MAKRDGDRKSGFGASLFVLVVLIGLGAWNYHRNWMSERSAQAQQPFMTYDRSSLEQLEAAYAADLDAAKHRSGRRAEARATARDVDLLGDAVQEFDRVARVAAQRRDATGSIAQSEARLAQVRSELARRTPAYTWLVHVQRLTGLSVAR